MVVFQNDFEWFHAHPELPNREHETTTYLRQRLVKAGLEILELDLSTGLVAQVHGKQPGGMVAIRCDIDALPIQEETGLRYRSVHENRMHACGHDFNTAVVLAATLELQNKKDGLPGNVKVIFQPAEEDGTGALQIIDTGILSGVDVIFGIHAFPGFPVGTLGIKAGSVTAAVDRFKIRIRGRGCHAAHPDQGIDPIVVAGGLITSIQSLVSRRLHPFHAGLVSITRLTAGNTWNIIPETALLEGTVRTLDAEDRKKIPIWLKDMVDHTAQAFGAQGELSWLAGPPATRNDNDWAAFAEDLAKQEGFAVQPSLDSLGGEDFAFYQQHIPGLYVHIGTGIGHPIHHPQFCIDQDALAPASAFMVSLVGKALHHIKEKIAGE